MISMGNWSICTGLSAITTIIRNPAGGFTAWGNRTLSADPKWSFVHRVRILYILMDAIQVGQWQRVDKALRAATTVEELVAVDTAIIDPAEKKM